MRSRMVVWLLFLLCVADVPASLGDYTYSCWLNGWRKNPADQSPDIFGIETSRYGFTLDVADFRKVGFGSLTPLAGYEQALAHKADRLVALPPAELSIELEVDGVRYRARACKAGQEQGVKHLSSVRLWESGRYVQHYDFAGLDLRNASGGRLDCDAMLDLVAWPGSLTFNLNVTAGQAHERAVLRLRLHSDVGTWSQEVHVTEPWKPGEQERISMSCPVPADDTVRSARITVSTENGERVPVRFDERKHCYVASATRLKRSWKTGYTDIRNYDDFTIDVEGRDSQENVPFLLDLRPPANVTGLCPILCDQEGRPTGVAVQLSKNWHYKPMGSYLMAYTLLPAEKTTTYTLRIVYGFYGTLPSASHAQLSLVGYGGNGRWDQLAIGCWGETICFDMDMSLVDVAITDIRMLMARQGLDGKMWGWTEAGWGGDWLNIRDDNQEKYFQNNLKTAYLSQGPCLTDVKYEGYYGAGQEVDFKARLQTLRTDDYNRTFHRLSYTFTQGVSARKMWLFKLGRTYHYCTPRIAYGNRDGCLGEEDAPNTLDQGHLVLDNVTLAGAAPYWVALPGAFDTSGTKPNGYRALIIRQYQVVVDGNTYPHPTLSAPVYQADPTNLDIELLPPAGVRQFHRGDRITLDLELITLPREADDYYGPNHAFRRHLADNPNSWKTTLREAVGNDLAVKVTGGRTLRSYPLIIQVEKPEVTVEIRGGVGAVPMRFEGLAAPGGNRLFQVINGDPVLFDQSVHGHDYWQTEYEEATNSYRMSYNLPLDGLDESTWIFAQD